MQHEVFRYRFAPQIPMGEVRDALRLATVATESVFGRFRVLLHADFELSESERRCWIDASTEVGRHLHKVFRGYIARKFGPGSFLVSNTADEPVLMTT